MNDVAAPIRYCFARFELQPGDRRLLANGEPVHLGPHAFDVLVVLVEHSGHLVTKSALLERVWGKVIVEENTLQVHISALRKVLGADAIATVAGRGYRFVPDVQEVAASLRAGPRKHNLPHALTSFIGREKEIARAGRLLAGTRLLTLTGAGGCGKTRLALQLAAEAGDGFPDGTWLAELAPLNEPELLAQTIAKIFAIKEQPGRELAQTLADWLASRRLLLVLDNAEHLLDASAHLADMLLRRSPGLAILVTSRERLGITGEATFRVPSLSVPDAQGEANREEILASEAARLFIDRARLQLPDFEIAAADTAALATICRRLDGIALAIELAAPRVRSMSLQELGRHLDDRFRVLTDGSRTAMPRHRTLRSLIDWSYELLNGAEKAMLERVSVFVGGWTLPAAEDVCAGEGIEREDVLGLLDSLIRKSLVLAEERDGQTRYGMLETVAEYARERLRQGGAEALALLRRQGHFLALAEAARENERESNRLLHAERDNIRAVLTHCSAPGGDVAAGMRLAAAMTTFWAGEGHLAEGRSCITALLAAAPPDADKALRAGILRGAGMFAQQLGDYAAAFKLREEAYTLWKELGDRRQVARALNGLGAVAHARGDYEAARAYREESLAMARTLDDPALVAGVLFMLGHGAQEVGDFAASRALLEESVAIARRLGEGHAATPLYLLGITATYEGDLPRARTLFEESLRLRRELGERGGIAACIDGLARVSRLEGDCVTALRLLREALAIVGEIGDPRDLAESLQGLAPVAATLAGPEAGARIWGRVERLREELGSPLPPCDCERYRLDVAGARAALDDEAAFERAWEEGRTLSLHEVQSYAMALGA